ncbi:MAG: transglycosylase family protein [Propionibacteriaceae bacterium]
MFGSVRFTSIAKRAVGAVAALALAGGAVVATAPSADAAGNVWDRVAACESSGNWKINTGNGYYGGVQFSSSTWRAYGGRSYAGQANVATKSEQIKIAQRVLKAQGPGAWPVCSKRAGLTKSNGTAGASSTPKATKKKVVSTSATYVTVHRGDTLGKIAHRYHVKGGWKGLYKMNKSKIKNPNNIKVGWKLRVR